MKYHKHTYSKPLLKKNAGNITDKTVPFLISQMAGKSTGNNTQLIFACIIINNLWLPKSVIMFVFSFNLMDISNDGE